MTLRFLTGKPLPEFRNIFHNDDVHVTSHVDVKLKASAICSIMSGRAGRM